MITVTQLKKLEPDLMLVDTRQGEVITVDDALWTIEEQNKKELCNSLVKICKNHNYDKNKRIEGSWSQGISHDYTCKTCGLKIRYLYSTAGTKIEDRKGNDVDFEEAGT